MTTAKPDHALALTRRGFRVFPVKPAAKAPPLLTGWIERATNDEDTVRQFWLPMPDANVAISTEGYAVIDADTAKGGLDSLALLQLTEGLPATLTTVTPTGGKHLFYKLPPGHPGVPNSVGVLGAGLDLRSTGGYVLAPGSVVPAGEYVFENPAVAVAYAPQWLLDRLGQPPTAKAAPATPVTDAPDQTLEAARTWLQGQDGAQAGTTDARAYEVACGLRDRGLSQAQACDLIGEWNDRCERPRTPRELMRKVRNAYAYGQNEPGARVALPSDFPVVERPIEQAVSRVVPKLLSLADFANREAKSAGYVVKGLLQRASYASIYGAPGEGKTFAALDIAYHVAAGREWMGRKVHAGPVLYLAYEGTGGLVARAKALRQKYGNQEVPFFIVSATYNLREKTGRAELGDTLALLPEKPVLIVADTFARALVGGDENSAQDVGAFNGAVAALIESTNACVTVIHHSGKDKSRGARGSSALLGALDTEIEVDSGALKCKKQRDIEISEPIGFKLTPLVVGIDADGDETTSCVLEAAALMDLKSLPRLGGNNRRGFDVLCTLRPNNEPVTYGAWRDACREFLGDKNVPARFSDIKRNLQKYGYIIEDGQKLITRRCE